MVPPPHYENKNKNKTLRGSQLFPSDPHLKYGLSKGTVARPTLLLNHLFDFAVVVVFPKSAATRVTAQLHHHRLAASQGSSAHRPGRRFIGRPCVQVYIGSLPDWPITPAGTVISRWKSRGKHVSTGTKEGGTKRSGVGLGTGGTVVISFNHHFCWDCVVSRWTSHDRHVSTRGERGTGREMAWVVSIIIPVGVVLPRKKRNCGLSLVYRTLARRGVVDGEGTEWVHESI